MRLSIMTVGCCCIHYFHLHQCATSSVSTAPLQHIIEITKEQLNKLPAKRFCSTILEVWQISLKLLRVSRVFITFNCSLWYFQIKSYITCSRAVSARCNLPWCRAGLSNAYRRQFMGTNLAFTAFTININYKTKATKLFILLFIVFSCFRPTWMNSLFYYSHTSTSFAVT